MARSLSPRGLTGIAGAVIALAVVGAYAGSLSGPFVFDDIESIVENGTLRNLWPISGVLSPPFHEGQTVGGRPLLNLSFGLNYAWGGLNPFGYHCANLAIHVLAALLLFGAVRRTLRSARPQPGDGRTETWLAAAVALLWALHPLDTEAVTYVVQRAESLMGLFFLLAVYAFIRGNEAESAGLGRAKGWFLLCFVACLLGVGTKEVMAVAPVVILLYDRTFVSGGFSAALKRHRLLYGGLVSTWLPLAWLVHRTANRGGSMGFGVAVPLASQVLTQFVAIAHYLRLAVWPDPLIFDYGPQRFGLSVSTSLAVVVVLGLVASVLVGLGRGRAWGFLGAAFFAVLLPTSVVPEQRQTMVEHRMYLALIPLVIAAVVGLFLVGRKILKAKFADRGWTAGLAAIGLLAGLYGEMTYKRNQTYQSVVGLWSDTVAKCPANPYAHNNLGRALVEAHRLPEALMQFGEAARLAPGLPDAQINLANALAASGKVAEAIPHYQQAIAIVPSLAADAHYNLGNALAATGDPGAAASEFEAAIRINPAHSRALYNLANLLAGSGRYEKAEEYYRRVIREQPGFTDARVNLAHVCMQLGQLDEAERQYRAALVAEPNSADLHYNLGVVLATRGRLREARDEFVFTLRLQSGFAPARDGLQRIEALLSRP